MSLGSKIIRTILSKECDMTKQILFITSTRIGDAVLSTGVLNHLASTYDDFEVTVVCGPLCTSLFEGYPNLKEIVALKKEKHHKHWFKLWRKVFTTRWFMVVDLRDSFVSRAIWAKHRYTGTRRLDKSAHKVVQAAQLIGQYTDNKAPAPKLWFTAAQLDKVKSLIGEDRRPILAVGPTANWIGKTWPRESFIKLLHRLVLDENAPLQGHRIAILAAPGEEADAQYILNELPENIGMDIIAKTSPGEAAAFLSKSAFYIGNDSGLMHCAAACGVKTFGLFGPSWPHLYSPWGAHSAHIATAQNFDELVDFEGYDPKTLDHSLMTSLTVDTVYDAVASFVKSE